MRTEDKEFIQMLIADILDLPRNSVIWAFPNAPRPQKPYAVLQLYSFQREAQEEIAYKGEEYAYCSMPDELYGFEGQENVEGFDKGRFADVEYKEYFDVKVPVAGVLRIQFLGDGAVDRLEYLMRKLEAPSIVDRCHSQGIAFFDSTSVTDVESLLSGQTYEQRASVDTSIRYTSDIVDDIHTINRVEVESDINDVKRIIDVKE